MNIDVSHRKDLIIHPRNAYFSYANSCIKSISKIRNVCSIVLCGSLAKGDVIPGWSDIDLIVFLENRSASIEDLEKIKWAITKVSANYKIGIGLDIVYVEEFNKTKKINGRPYMMTFEVARYGWKVYGNEILAKVRYTEKYRRLVEMERHLLVASEIHSWRRNYVFSNRTDNSLTYLFNSCKCLLRILQIETGPNFKKPVNVYTSLEKYKKSHSVEQSVIMEVAIDIRKNWQNYFNLSSNERMVVADRLARSINGYIYY